LELALYAVYLNFDRVICYLPFGWYQREVEVGSTIHSDEWRAYSNLSDHGYVHKTVNHQLHFIDPKTEANTQSIESTWRRVKVKYGIKTCGAKLIGTAVDGRVVAFTQCIKESFWPVFWRHEKEFFNVIMSRCPDDTNNLQIAGWKIVDTTPTQFW
jgi:hypothetical protein